MVLTSEGVRVGVDFSDFQAVTPICQEERASLLCLGADSANSHWTVKCADPQVQLPRTQFTLLWIFRSNKGGIIIVQHIMLKVSVFRLRNVNTVGFYYLFNCATCFGHTTIFKYTYFHTKTGNILTVHST
jgi:hypothetical protein